MYKLHSIVSLAIITIFNVVFLQWDTTLNNVKFVVDLEPIEVKSTKIDPQSVELLSRLVHAEAGNQCYLGQLAVATVVLNRSGQRTDFVSLRRVIFAKNQFNGAHSRHFRARPSGATKTIVREALAGMRAFDANVLYFHNPRIATNVRWVASISRNKRYVIGDHVFCCKTFR